MRPINGKERIRKVFAFDATADRAPVMEWASWWNQTLDAWRREGLPEGDPSAYWGHDSVKQFWLPVAEPGLPAAARFGAPLIETEGEYRALKEKYLFSDRVLETIGKSIESYLEEHDCADTIFWYTLDGFFWFPRKLLGIEPHLYAFYDAPDLMMEINEDLCAFHKKAIEIVHSLIEPSFMTIAEDMSYNHGPMIGRGQYDEFMLPFYRQITPLIRSRGTRVFIDSDGMVEPLIDWFVEGGIEGILPLERMAGVDVGRIRAAHPAFLMIGGFDKTVMHRGEAAMRAEFERLLPVIRSGGFIPSVDHQTPPDVSMENYAVYCRLLREYCAQACRGCGRV